MKIRHLGPHKETEPVGPVEPARIFDFLVLAGPVEAEGFRQLDVATEVGVGGGRVPTARKVPLVQHQSLGVGLAVEVDVAIARLDRPQPEIAFDPVKLGAGLVEKPRGHGIENGRLRRPGHNLRQRDAPLPRHATEAADRSATERDREVDLRERARRGDLEVQGALVQRRPQPQRRDMKL